MASRDIRTFFGQGGGDDEKKESERAKKQIEKRKADQKSYDKAKRRRLIQESWLEEFTWAVYGDIYNFPQQAFEKVMDDEEIEDVEMEENLEKEYEMEEENDNERVFVAAEDFDESDVSDLEDMDETDSSSGEEKSSTSKSKKPAKKFPKKKRARVEIEYEEEINAPAVSKLKNV